MDYTLYLKALNELIVATTELKNPPDKTDKDFEKWLAKNAILWVEAAKLSAKGGVDDAQIEVIRVAASTPPPTTRRRAVQP